MTEILSIDVNIFEDNVMYQKALHLISEERRKKIQNFKNPLPARLSLGAGVLLSIALERYGLQEKVNEIKTDTHGKPYIEGADFHFSLSHSGNYAVCAFGNTPVGVDLQQTKGKISKHIDRILSDSEKKYLFSLSEPEMILAFYRLWTKKESLLKWDGRGLRFPMQEISFIQNGFFIDTINFSGKKLHVTEYKTFFPDYMLSVCSEEDSFSAKIEQIYGEFLTIL